MKDEKPSEEMGLYSNVSYNNFINDKTYLLIGTVIVLQKLGISQDVLTVNTGIKDINRVGMIERVNGEPSLNHWSTDDCNRYFLHQSLTETVLR